MKKKNLTSFILGVLWKADAFDFCALLVSDAFTCAIPLVCTKLISDIVTAFSSYSVGMAKYVLHLAILYVLLNIFSQVILPIKEFMQLRFKDKIAGASELMMFEKISSFHGVECFESHEFYNKLLLAKDGSGIRFISITDMFSAILSGFITVCITVFYLVKVQWLIATIALLALLPATLYNFWVASKRLGLFRSQSEPSRKLKYYGDLFTEPVYSKEMRLFHLGQYIIDKYKKLFSFEFVRINKSRKKYAVTGVFCTAISALLSGLALYMFVHRAVNQKAEAGSIVLYIALLPQFVMGIRAIVNGVVQTKNNNHYVQHFIDFLQLDTPEEPEKQLQLPVHSISFSDVSFQYPQTSGYAMSHVSFECKSPCLVAIVGENGSGKSTLVKLLLKLFMPTCGEITVNGTDIRNINSESYLQAFSGVFQSPAKFAFSVNENIRFADVNTEIDSRNIIDSCERSGAANFVNSLPNGYESVLGKQFSGGTDISDGQWQKLSLARALCANAEVLIFDEASADLDPKAEYMFYQTIREYAKDKLTFYITHRLSGTKDADLILVMDNGLLAEKGTHSELMAMQGIYYRLYNMQAEGYEV
jgi:ATP-binding cassette subfamily B protein